MKTRCLNNYSTGLMFAGILLLFPLVGQAVEYDLRGQLSGWTIESGNKGVWENNSGLRYIPQLILKQPLNNDSFFDTEISFNSLLKTDSRNSNEKPDLELYRLKLRFATKQTETRLGLQKINFGPALLLRPLRWFDRVDQRDPLKLTNGVYGLRFKYNALNNANFWFWCLYGNDDTKGYETFPTSSGKPEFGGRLQHPVPYGELAATFHTRSVAASQLKGTDYSENRFALDGRWDIKIGFWFESVLQQQKTTILPYEWTKIITLGTDYTFGVGNGLYVLGEHMASVLSDKPLELKEDQQTSAFNLNYPIGYLDNLMAIGYYSWELEKYYQYLSWQRIYDNLIFNFSFFKYPQDNISYHTSGQNVLGSGYGGQIMIIFNH